MSDLLVPYIICFQTQKQLAPSNNALGLLKGDLIDLRARSLVHATTSLRARYVHARHRVRNLSSPVVLLLKVKKIFLKCFYENTSKIFL